MRKLMLTLGLLMLLLLAVQVRIYLRPQSGQDVAGLRIVSMAPNLTGLLFELGAGDQVVGVTSFCNYPSEALEKTKIGDFLNPNYEQTVQLEPDLILAEKWSSSRSTARLRQLGLTVVEVPSPKSIAEIYRLIEVVGEAVDRIPQAKRLIADMDRRIARLEARARTFPHFPTLYLEIDLPTWTVGGASFTSEAIERCGAKNIFADLTQPASQVSEESVVQRDPEIIISFVASQDQIAGRQGWSSIRAVLHRRVIDDFAEDLLSRGNHRVVDGMEELQRRVIEVMGFDRRLESANE